MISRNDTGETANSLNTVPVVMASEFTGGQRLSAAMRA